MKPQETKAKHPPCSPVSSATPCRHGPAPARGLLCPRTPDIPTNTVGTHSVWSMLRRLVRARPIVRAWPLSVLWPMGPCLAYCRYSGASSGLWRMVSPPAHGRCPGPALDSGPLSVLWRMGGTPASRWCASPASVLWHAVGTQPDDYEQTPSTTPEPAQQSTGADALQLTLRFSFRARLTAGVRLHGGRR
jgi:hypothetical protein